MALVGFQTVQAKDTPYMTSKQKAEIVKKSQTTLKDTNLYHVKREGRQLVVHLKQKHRVLSTSDINGGERENIKHIVNFQSMEANNHHQRFKEIVKLSNEKYHASLAERLNIPETSMVSMGTAANIANTAYVIKSFHDLTVEAYVTAGVSGNALRAGDHASWYQSDSGNVYVGDDSDHSGNKIGVDEAKEKHKDSGTINIIVLINRPVTPGALAKAASLVTEAKSAALSTLAISSTVSPSFATGTGTDQYAIAAPLVPKEKVLGSASGHLKIGELIGVCVYEAVLKALELQEGLTPLASRQVSHVFKRFKVTNETLLNDLEKRLSDEEFALLRDNASAIFSDPKLVAAAYAYSAVLDRIQNETFDNTIRGDVLLDQAVNVAVAIAGPGRNYRESLQKVGDEELDAFLQAFVLGWKAKWQ
ncbi:MAG: adenosylcobinamide amidohydrolase [Gammaproteobacteria bacterium]|nr:adenosylcobinamide amidohydrolase [Gammaproteobacteria bacterium]